MQVKEWWWEGDDMIVVAVTGEKYKLHKPYLSSVKWGELEYDSCDEVTIELSKRYDEDQARIDARFKALKEDFHNRLRYVKTGLENEQENILPPMPINEEHHISDRVDS